MLLLLLLLLVTRVASDLEPVSCSCCSRCSQNRAGSSAVGLVTALLLPLLPPIVVTPKVVIIEPPPPVGVVGEYPTARSRRIGNLFLVQLRSSSSVLNRGRGPYLPVFWFWLLAVAEHDEDVDGSSGSSWSGRSRAVSEEGAASLVMAPSGTSVPIECRLRIFWCWN